MSISYSSVWRTGATEQKVFTNATWNNFLSKSMEFRNLGFNLTSISTSGADESRRWTGVFSKGDGEPFELVGHLDANEFDDAREKFAAKGLRLTGIESFSDKGKIYYTGVWETVPAGEAAEKIWVNASWEKFKPVVKRARTQGLRLVDFSTHNAGSGRRWCGVWHPGTFESRMWVDGDLDNLQQRVSSFAGAGLRLARLQAYWEGGRARYAGLWREHDRAHILKADQSLEEFKRERSDHAGQLELVDLAVRSSTSDAVGGPRVTVVPVVIAPPQRFSVHQMAENMVRVFAQPRVGIFVDVKPPVKVNRPELTRIVVNKCLTQTQMHRTHRKLFDVRDGVGPGEIAAYFVATAKDSKGPLSGCAVHPPGLPGLILTGVASEWSLAHEVMHVLGRENHSSDKNDLMYHSTSKIPSGILPRIHPGEMVTILRSAFVRR